MHNVRNHLCSFPNLELPITVDDIFTEDDYDLIYNREKFNDKVEIVEHPDMFGWTMAQTENMSWMYSPNEHKIAGTDIVLDKNEDFIVGEKMKGYRPPTSIGVITNKKLMYTLREFAQDTFHEDYLADIWSLGGKKIVPITLIGFSGPSTFHTEGLSGWRKVADESLLQNRIETSRTSAVCNFRLLGDADDYSIEVAEPDDVFTAEYDELNRRFTDQWKVDGKEPVAMWSDNGISVSETIDQTSSNEMLQHLTPCGKIEGYHSPFLLNLSSWHRVNIKTVAPRVSLRFMGHKNQTFEHFQKLIDEGKFLK